MAYIQLAHFKLKPGVSENALIEAERGIRDGKIRQQPGYLGRDLARGENGEWLVILRWENKEDGEAWSPIFRQAPEAQAFMAVLDMASMRQEHFTLEPL